MLSMKAFNALVLVCVLRMFRVNCYSENTVVLNKSSAIRHKRTLNFYFPYNSCYALAVVLVLPLEDLPADRSVFLSYNFEANFYYPYYSNTDGIVPVPFTYIDEPGANAGTKHRVSLPPAYRQFNDAGEADQIIEIENAEIIQFSNNTAKPQNKTKHLNEDKSKASIKKVEKTKKKSRKVRALLKNYLMSRRRFYKMMESKMERSGLQGNDCLLKAICETAQSAFGVNNGVIGSVIDVLFLPSASKDEKLPKRYYQAERNGKAGDCVSQYKKCPKSIFDFISKII